MRQHFINIIILYMLFSFKRNPSVKVKKKSRLRQTVVQFSCLILFIWLFHRTVRNVDILEVKHIAADWFHKSNNYQPLVQFSPTKAIAGRIFFHRLIHKNDSYKFVNEDNLCSLIHFFIQQATLNNRPVRFSSGTFILYDSTGRFFKQLMMAKNAQIHSGEHRSGYILRLQHFIFDATLTVWQRLLGQPYSTSLPFIYLRGDESSHFHERGNNYERWHDYPAYGADIPHGCLPNHFGHILFGKLKGQTELINSRYQGDRIYVKPEEYGLQKFSHYIAHGRHYIRAISELYVCRWLDRWNRRLCERDGVFHEWTDRIWIERWDDILRTLDNVERRDMLQLATANGVQEIYRQALQLRSWPQVEHFRLELERHYGSDVSVRKGNEIILTTRQLLNGRDTCDSSSINPDSKEP